MAIFLVEFRIHGYAKEHVKEVIYSVASEFRVRGVTRNKVVPHICLYGPGNTDDMRGVIATIEKIGRKYTLVPFRIKGVGFFEARPKVIYFDISPSQQLEELRWELSQELSKLSTGRPWDSQKNYSFHASIAFHDIDRKFNQIWSSIKSKEQPNISQHLLRITVLGAHRRIICEYDLVFKRLLRRREALNKRLWRNTISQMRKLQGLSPEQEQPTLNWLQKLLKWLS
jgi:2'-5' RNA ligase